MNEQQEPKQENKPTQPPLMKMADIEKEFQDLCEMAGATSFEIRGKEAQLQHIQSRMAFLVDERHRVMKKDEEEKRKSAEGGAAGAEEKRKRKEGKKQRWSLQNSFRKMFGRSAKTEHELKDFAETQAIVACDVPPTEAKVEPCQ